MKKMLALFLALSLCLALTACGGEASTGTTGPGKDTLYTINIRTNAGVIPSGIKYYVYRDASRQTGIVTYGTLDSSGKIAFTAPESNTYTLVLENVQEGYNVQPEYTLDRDRTELVIPTSVVTGEPATGKEYYLGDMMRDFTITDTEGNTYTVSELLKSYKCVVLNIWNIDCNPCKAEFPHLQKAYEMYKDDVALIAMNPVPGDSLSEISEFKDRFGLIFPMASCEPAWVQAMAPMGNPTTVIIDRFGRICVKETGGIPDGVFEKVFEHFVATDYQQILIRDMQTFAAEQA